VQKQRLRMDPSAQNRNRIFPFSFEYSLAIKVYVMLDASQKPLRILEQKQEESEKQTSQGTK